MAETLQIANAEKAAARRATSKSVTRESLVIGALLAGSSVPEVARLVGLSRRTIERLRNTETFQQSFREARSALLTGTIDKLRNIGSDSVDVLHKISLDEKARGTDRVLAARHSVDLLFRGVQLHDFEERLRKLEEVAGQK